MRELEPPDTHHVNAAIGWLMLGNATEAWREFDRIRAELREHPAVLDAEWRLLANEKRWPEAAQSAERLWRACPDDANSWIHRSFALHELRRTREALELLLPAAERFPKEATIPYNLACYTCQIGDLSAARRWFKRALALDKTPEKLHRLRAALEDADLQPLWPGLRQMLEQQEARYES